MHDQALDQIRQIWPTLDQGDQQQVVEQFRQTIKEMIDEHFRISAAAAPQPQSEDLCKTVESQSGHHEQGEPAYAVRAA